MPGPSEVRFNSVDDKVKVSIGLKVAKRNRANDAVHLNMKCQTLRITCLCPFAR